jgi:hypothetical protein
MAAQRAQLCPDRGQHLIGEFVGRHAVERSAVDGVVGQHECTRLCRRDSA